MSESDKDRAERLQRENAQLRDQRDSALNAKTREVTKRKRLEKRVKNGICPCCTRSFVNLQRHIQSKHPEFACAAA